MTLRTPHSGRSRARVEAHLQGWWSPALGRHVIHLGRQSWQRGPGRSGNCEEGLGERKSRGERHVSPECMDHIRVVPQTAKAALTLLRGSPGTPKWWPFTLRPGAADCCGEVPRGGRSSSHGGHSCLHPSHPGSGLEMQIPGPRGGCTEPLSPEGKSRDLQSPPASQGSDVL